MYDWPDDIENIEQIEEGNWTIGDKTYDWKLTMADQADPVYVNLTQSEHSSGRGADLRVVSTTRYTVKSSDAYLRPPPEYDEIKDPDPPRDFWQTTDEIRYDDGVWEIVDGISVCIVDRSEDGTVVEVEGIDGTTLGWTNASNLDPERNPGVSIVELAEIALETPVKRAVEGVSPFDTRIGIHDDDE